MVRKRTRKANPYQQTTPQPSPKRFRLTSYEKLSLIGALFTIVTGLPPVIRQTAVALKTEELKTAGQSQQRIERPAVEAPVLQDRGPTDDGSTKIELTNSIPHEMTFTMQQDKAEKKGAILKPCPDCEIYMANVPEDACDRGTKDLFSVAPGEHRIRGSWTNANISDIAATWKLKPGRKYSLCLVLDTTRGKSDWDHQ